MRSPRHYRISKSLITERNDDVVANKRIQSDAEKCLSSLQAMLPKKNRTFAGDQVPQLQTLTSSNTEKAVIYARVSAVPNTPMIT